MIKRRLLNNIFISTYCCVIKLKLGQDGPQHTYSFVLFILRFQFLTRPYLLNLIFLMVWSGLKLLSNCNSSGYFFLCQNVFFFNTPNISAPWIILRFHFICIQTIYYIMKQYSLRNRDIYLRIV